MKRLCFLLLIFVGILDCACITNPQVYHPVRRECVLNNPKARQFYRCYPPMQYMQAARYREVIVYESRLSRSRGRSPEYASSQSPLYGNASMENKRFDPGNSSYASADEYRLNRIESSLENLHRKISFLEGKVDKNVAEIRELSNIKEELALFKQIMYETNNKLDLIVRKK